MKCTSFQLSVSSAGSPVPQAGINPRDFEDVQRIINQLQSRQAFVDPQNLQALLQSAADKMKQAEFDLRKKAEGDDQPEQEEGREDQGQPDDGTERGRGQDAEGVAPGDLLAPLLVSLAAVAFMPEPRLTSPGPARRPSAGP